MMTLKLWLQSSLLGLLISFTPLAMADAKWSPAPDSMLTQWGEQITPQNAWQQYPRPQMQRDNWQNLNGLWHYAVQPRSQGEPKKWAGNILVPFAIESPLSGVKTRLSENDALWYQRDFTANAEGKNTLLHFEAVDYATRVWVNDTYVGSHRGGNLPFSFDISKALKSGTNTLTVRVIDDTDAPDRYQLRGKQTRDNQGIWYTPVSGIWQTVWLEHVSSVYAKALKLEASANGELHVNVKTRGEIARMEVVVSDGTKQVAQHSVGSTRITLAIPNVQAWNPSHPKLYDVNVTLFDRQDEQIDQIKSYAGFRTISRAQDKNGNWQFTLNGKPEFQLGPLDQGWWPDGLLTPPSEAAIVKEMRYLKDAGYNLIRKHKKVEPRRYYYLADKLGFLIWQDQVSGGTDSSGNKQEWPVWNEASKAFEDRMKGEIEADWPQWAHQQYMDELSSMIDTLYNHPSIIVWTTFNERWGQHRTMKIGRFVEQYDTSRLLNIASGGNFFPVGDIADAHHYPEPVFLTNEGTFDNYVKVVGEYGGHGWAVKDHLWAPGGKQMIYGNMPASLDEYKQRYIRSANDLAELKSKGIAAGVYTQTSDVETELNGLLTYDRAVEKFTADELLSIHKKAGLIENIACDTLCEQAFEEVSHEN
ncbi:glycoside hydrolase family 2 [Alteromonas pelagimontana]|uniref:Glycoside hydrolase family 2 n=1 Tax=Alteromonas pelagimontana TaxID=1858656 RepID=A0A6M4MAY5_9ALTE|nr:glycoside hydrolase family 2 [Alteromonas pelagimontana]QJR79958.1 glycoside hydrolase family 2 [Alteromonas pelagimontana]